MLAHSPTGTAGNSPRPDLADRVTAAFGSMRLFWILVIWQISWICAATLGIPPFNHDRYPFGFCLFVSNLIQLWSLPILGTTANRAEARRNVKADADHVLLMHMAHQINALVARRPVEDERETGVVRLLIPEPIGHLTASEN